MASKAKAKAKPIRVVLEIQPPPLPKPPPHGHWSGALSKWFCYEGQKRVQQYKTPEDAWRKTPAANIARLLGAIGMHDLGRDELVAERYRRENPIPPVVYAVIERYLSKQKKRKPPPPPKPYTAKDFGILVEVDDLRSGNGDYGVKWKILK